MDKQEAIEYLEKVINTWTTWVTHHDLLVEAIKVLLEEVKEK